MERDGGLTLNELRIFLEFARTEHLGQAAEALELSTAAVQRAVRSLEERLGVPLFARDGRRLRLLHAGRILADQAARVLRSRDDAIDAVHVAAGIVGDVVRVGYLYSLGMRVLPELIARVKAAVPEARVELRHGSTEELVGGVLASELDAACVAPLPEQRELETVAMFEEPMLLCVPAGDALAGRAGVDLRAVRTRPFASLRQGFGTRTYLLDACARAGFRPAFAYEVDDIFTLEGLIGAGLAVSVLPAQMRALANPRVAYMALAPSCATARVVGLVFRRAGKRHRAFAELVATARAWAP